MAQYSRSSLNWQSKAYFELFMHLLWNHRIQRQWHLEGTPGNLLSKALLKQYQCWNTPSWPFPRRLPAMVYLTCTFHLFAWFLFSFSKLLQRILLWIQKQSSRSSTDSLPLVFHFNLVFPHSLFSHCLRVPYPYHGSYIDPIFISYLRGSTSHAFLNPDKWNLLFLENLLSKEYLTRKLPIFNKCVSFHLSFALSL